MKDLFVHGDNLSLGDVYEIVFDAHLEGIRNGLLSKPSGKESFDHAIVVVSGLFGVDKDIKEEKRIKLKSHLTSLLIFETMMEAVECGNPFTIESYDYLQDSICGALHPNEDPLRYR